MSEHETLRDTFAAAALKGALAGRLDRLVVVEERHADVWANMAGLLADAMLRERARTNSAEVSNTLRNGAPDARETVQPTLTDAERWTLQTVRDRYASHDEDEDFSQIATTIDALLARHGGGK